MARPYGVDKEPVNVRLPRILLARIRTEIKRRKIGMTDFIEDASRAYLDGAPVVPPRADVHDNGSSRPPASELAARFGITTAAHLEKTAKINETFSPVFVGDCPVEDVALRRDWTKLYRDMQEMEPAEAEYAFNHATAEVKLPVGFRRQPPAKQVAWLQVNA